jgi:hypothetical protein
MFSLFLFKDTAGGENTAAKPAYYLRMDVSLGAAAVAVPFAQRRQVITRCNDLSMLCRQLSSGPCSRQQNPDWC